MLIKLFLLAVLKILSTIQSITLEIHGRGTLLFLLLLLPIDACDIINWWLKMGVDFSLPILEVDKAKFQGENVKQSFWLLIGTMNDFYKGILISVIGNIIVLMLLDYVLNPSYTQLNWLIQNYIQHNFMAHIKHT